MRLKFLVWVLALVLLVGLASATTNDAVESWSFNDNSTPLLSDGSFGSTASNSGADRVFVSSGNYAYDFEKADSNDQITLASGGSDLSNLFSDNTGVVSFSLWVRPESTTSNGALVSQGRAGNDGVGLYLKSTNQIAIGQIGTSETSGTDTIPDGKFSNVIVIWDKSNNKVVFFLNGSMDSGGYKSFIQNSASGIDTWLGKMSRLSGDPIDAIIDQVIIYNRNLTLSEISELSSDISYNPYVVPVAPDNFTFRLTSGTGLSVDWGNGTVLTNSTGSVIVTGINRSDTQSLESFVLFKTNNFNISVSNWNTTQDYNFSFTSYPFINVSNLYDNSALSGFNVSIDGFVYEDGDVDGVVFVPFNTSKSVTLSLDGFISNTSTFDFSGPLDYFGFLYQSVIDFSAYEVVTGSLLSGVNFSVNGSQAEVFYLDSGGYYVTASKDGYFSKNLSFSVSPLDELTLNVSNLSNSLVSFNLTDIVTGVTVAVPSYVNITHLNSSWSTTFSGLAGNFSASLLQGAYSLVLWADNYSFRFENVTINASVQNVTYGLYSNNSVWVYAFDVDSGAPLYTFAVEVFDNATSLTANESGGYAAFNSVPSGVYTVSVSRSGYITNTYALTMTGGSHQRIDAYLTNDAAPTNTIFTVSDVLSGIAVEEVTSNQYRTIGGVWTLISSKDTDLTGRAQFGYTAGVEYRFDFIGVGYETRVIYLEPLFSSYNVPLTPELETDVDTNVGDWVYLIEDSLFYNNQLNNFSVTLSSGSGTIEYYNLSFTSFNGSVFSVFCNNSYGCTDSFSVNISGASLNDTVSVAYSIKEAGRGLKSFSRLYLIQGTYEDNTVAGWEDADFGSLEKVVVATIVMLILLGVVVAVAYMVGAPPVTVSGIVLTAAAFVFGGVGFIPMYSAYLVGIGTLLIVIFGRGEI